MSHRFRSRGHALTLIAACNPTTVQRVLIVTVRSSRLVLVALLSLVHLCLPVMSQTYNPYLGEDAGELRAIGYINLGGGLYGKDPKKEDAPSAADYRDTFVYLLGGKFLFRLIKIPEGQVQQIDYGAGQESQSFDARFIVIRPWFDKDNSRIGFKVEYIKDQVFDGPTITRFVSGDDPSGPTAKIEETPARPELPPGVIALLTLPLSGIMAKLRIRKTGTTQRRCKAKS